MAKLNNTLEEITHSFSLFKENQVLTATQLNQVVHYFDDQDRLTRTLGIGVGLICGFEVKFVPSAGKIDISRGCGITTDGDLMHWDNLHSLSRYRLFEDEKAEYPYFYNEAGKMPLWELFGDESEQEGLKNISAWAEKDATGANIKHDDLAVVAYLENYQKEPDTCTELNCDNHGIQVLRNLKFLLIEKSNLDFIIESFDTIFNKYKKVYNAQSKLPRIKIGRVILNSLNAASESDLYAAYAVAINALRPGIKSGLEALYANYSGLLNPSNTVSMTAWTMKLDALLSLNVNQTIKWFQYRYDWAKDIVQTYTDLRDTLQRLEKECCPDPSAFPKHLMLSELIVTNKQADYRHGFYPSPAVSRESETLQHAKFLFQKLNRQILNFTLSNTQEIRITPSKLYHGQHAIPYYYDTPKVYDNWNFELSKTGREEENLSYFAQRYAPDPPDDAVLNPLKYDMDQYDFLRIEGHIGQDYAQAIKEIKSKISSNGLPVDVVALRLGSLAERLNLEDYKCYFDDLEVVLKAWEVELNCLMKALSNFFSGFKLDVAGSHYEYALATREKSAKTIAKSTEKEVVSGKSSTLLAGKDTLSTNFFPQEAYKVASAFKEPITYKADTTVRDNVVKADDTLGIVLDKVFRENPAGSHNDIINETYKELNTGYDLDSWDLVQKEIAVDIPLNIIAVANDIGRYKPGDLGLIEESEIVTEFEARLNALCKQASGWTSKVNTYFTRAEYQKAGYEEKYLQILGELAQSCCAAEKLKILREEIAKRKDEILQNTLLAKYAQKHLGLEHLAGVPKGGTFVLVYKDNNQGGRGVTVAGSAANQLGLANKSAVAAVSAVKDMSSAISGSAGVESISQKSYAVANYTESSNLSGFSNREYLDKIADLYSEALGLLQGSATADSSLPGFTVVADFSLPYTCCSDCPPMSFILPKERVSLRLPVAFVCLGSEEDTILQFEVFPTDGIVSADIGNEAIIVREGGGYLFDANKLSQENFGKTISFKVNDQQTDTTLIVYEAVQVSFNVPPENINCFREKGVAIVKFNNTTPANPGSRLSYVWDFGDNSFGEDRTVRDPIHEYRLKDIEGKQPVTVTLTVSSGRCPTVATEQISICEVVADPCTKLSLEAIGKIGDKIEKYDRETLGNFVVLLETTIEIKNKILGLGDAVFEAEMQLEMLKNLMNINREVMKVMQKMREDQKLMLALAQLYLDQLMIMLYLLHCNWTEEGFGKEITVYFQEFVSGHIGFMIEVIEGVTKLDFHALLSAYLKDSPKISDELVEVLKRILEMFNPR